MQKVSFDNDLKDVDIKRTGDEDDSPRDSSAPELCLHKSGYRLPTPAALSDDGPA